MKILSSVFVCFAVAMAADAGAEGGFSDGRWRLQISGQAGIDSGGTDRGGDILGLSTVEYEFPVTGHIAVGLKLHPFFAYTQDENGIDDLFDGGFVDRVKEIDFDDFDLDADEDSDDTVWGAGFGLGARIYQVKNEQRGLFLDLGVSALFHDGEFNGNNSNINFMSGIGVGYQFKFGLNTVVHLDHISNAGLGDENSGANVIGVGLGFRF